MNSEKKKRRPDLSRKRIAQIPLSQTCKGVLLGSLLGDGFLKKEPGFANLRFKLRHSEVQEDYFFWKVKLLEEIATPCSVQRQKPDGLSRSQKLLFQSGARPQLTELWKVISNNSNTMIIERHWLNHMSALSLAVWWFDDGSIIKSNRRGVLCTDSFTTEACKTLAKYLESVWGIYCKVSPIKRKKTDENFYTKEEYNRLWFDTEEIKKLLRIVLPYANKEFTVKKCLLIYKNSDFQQRWISEMKGLLPVEGLKILENLESFFFKKKEA